MSTPEQIRPEEQPGNKEILRSAILNEYWVDPANPHVYLLLAHKISKDWWETPGGTIEGTPKSDLHFVDETLREKEEEIATSEPPSVEYFPIAVVGDDLLGSDSNIVIDDGIRKITSHPFIVREIFDRLPQIMSGSGHPVEHDDFVLVDVTPIYSEIPEVSLRAREN